MTAGGVGAVLVGGEAGIGKSRLVDHWAAGLDMHTLAGGCVELGAGGLPFAPFVAALRSLTGELDDGERVTLAPLLPGLPSPAPSDDARPRLFEGVLGLLARLSAARPTALVVEDVHWADRSTLDLLDYLIRNQQAAPGSLIVVTHRSDEPGSRALRTFLAGAGRLPWVERIALDRLRRPEVAAQIAAIQGRPADPGLVVRTHRRSDGNPLFVEALLGSSADEHEVPGSLADLLAGRVTRLEPEAARLARAAAVGGLRTPHAVLSAVLGRETGALDEPLRAAIGAGVLVVDGDGYRFRHALIRDAVLGELLPGERVDLHARYAAALSDQIVTAAAEQPGAELAHHLRAAGDGRGAMVAAAAAAGRAHHCLAYTEELQLLDQVLALWDAVPDASELVGADRITMLEKAAEAAARAGENERGERLADEALAEPTAAGQRVRTASLLELRYRLRARGGCGGAGDDLRAALEVAPHGSPIRPYLLNSLAAHLMDVPDPDGARDAAEQALAAAHRVGDDPAEAGALITLATLDARLGDLEAQLPRLARARAIAEALNAQRLRLRALDRESHLLHAYGRLDDAERVARAGLRAARDAGLARSAGPAHAVNLVATLISAGRWDEAVESVEHALDLVPPVNDHAHLLALRAVVTLHRGDLDLADRLVSRSDELVADDAFCQEPLLLPRLRVHLLLARGRAGAAAADVARMLTRERLDATSRFTWPVLVLAARVAASAGDAELSAAVTATAAGVPAAIPPQVAAARTLRALVGEGRGRTEWTAAITGWEEVSHPFELAEALVGRAASLLAAGERDAAAADLRRAHTLAAGLAAVPLVAEITDLARRGRLALGAGPQATDDVPTVTRLGLTPREAEVLGLVAEGLGNADIGERLFISAKTASVHVSNILGKLDVANRVEAAAEAHRLGLVPARASIPG